MGFMCQAVDSLLAKHHTDESIPHEVMGAPMPFALGSGLDERDAFCVARINPDDPALAAEN